MEFLGTSACLSLKAEVSLWCSTLLVCRQWRSPEPTLTGQLPAPSLKHISSPGVSSCCHNSVCHLDTRIATTLPSHRLILCTSRDASSVDVLNRVATRRIVSRSAHRLASASIRRYEPRRALRRHFYVRIYTYIYLSWVLYPFLQNIADLFKEH